MIPLSLNKETAAYVEKLIMALVALAIALVFNAISLLFLASSIRNHRLAVVGDGATVARPEERKRK